MDFGQALSNLKAGKRVAREGWNGKDMFIYLVPGSKFVVNRAPLLGIFPEGTEVNYGEHIDIRKADGTFGTWSPSNSDTLAEDWQVV